MYFKKFPKIDYTFQNGKTIPVVDIFRRVTFSQESINNSSVFTDTINGTGKKPEVLAKEYYNNTEYSWTIFMANQTVNPSFEWTVDHDTFIRTLQAKYTGDAYYVSNLPDLQEGDVAMVAILDASGQLLTVDTSKYALIRTWNSEFRYFVGVLFENDISISETCIFLRKNTEGKYRPIERTDGTIVSSLIRRKDQYLNTPRYFRQNGLVISPYRIFNGNNITDNTASPRTESTAEPEIITDSSTIFNTLLYRYITQQSLPPTITQVSIFEDELAIQNKLYNIKVIKPELISAVIDLFESALNSNTIGRAQQIELLI